MFQEFVSGCVGRRSIIATVLALTVALSHLLTGLALRADVVSDKEAIRDISDRRELFVDDWLIDSMRGVTLCLHPAVPREVALNLNQPWTGRGTGHTSVMKDGERYRLYCTNDTGGLTPAYASYAESTDGINWKLPKLGLIEYNGSKDNNIIWADKNLSSFNPFRDENPNALPEQRYKALVNNPPSLFTSPDGIHWKALKKVILLDGPTDTQNVAFWDGVRGEYVAYARLMKGQQRAIRTATSQDFLKWTPSRPVELSAGTTEQLYTNGITPYFRAPHMYVGLPMRYVYERQLDPKASDLGVSDGVFISSRDGVHFDRRFLESFIQPAIGIRNWTDRTNLPSWGVVPTGDDEMSVYWVEHYKHATVRLRRGSLRLDGFASVRATPAGGELVTRPLQFKGSRLQINFRTSAPGSIRVAVLESDGAEVSGLGLADCPDIYGNEIERTVKWKRGSDVGSLAGRPVRLKFVMRDADLYSLRFVP